MNRSRTIWQKIQAKLPPPLRQKAKDQWLDGFAILTWGILLLKYWITGKLGILIHPNYFFLTVIAGIALVVLGSAKLWQTYHQSPLADRVSLSPSTPNQPIKHITLFPPAWSSSLLLITALLGILITPKSFASQTALARGLTESLPVTRSPIQSFRGVSKPEERSLIDWVRTLNVYPEPDAYMGQKVKVQGFVVHPPNLSEQYIWLARFVITCCAADAYPIGLPVKLPTQNRSNYPPDQWLEITGQMTVAELNGKRKLVIQSATITAIPEPQNPYDY